MIYLSIYYFLRSIPKLSTRDRIFVVVFVLFDLDYAVQYSDKPHITEHFTRFC